MWCSLRWKPRKSLSSNRKWNLLGLEALQAALDFFSQEFESLKYILRWNHLPDKFYKILLTFWRLLAMKRTFPNRKELNFDQQWMAHDDYSSISTSNWFFVNFLLVYVFVRFFCFFANRSWNANRTKKIQRYLGKFTNSLNSDWNDECCTERNHRLA